MGDHRQAIRVGIDGRALLGDRSGIGRYVRELCREVDHAMPDAMFYVYSPMPVEMPMASARWIARVDESPLARLCKAALWLKLRAGALCRADMIDAFIGSAVFLPKLESQVRTVSIVYDLNFIHAPETMPFTTRWSYKLFFDNDVRRASRVVAISKGTSDRLEAYLGRRADAIISPAVSSDFRPRTPGEIANVLGHFGIMAPYLIAVGTREPRKNVELVLSSFLAMKEKGELKHHGLVLVGKRGWKNERFERLLARSSDKQIFPLGYVSDEYLPALYSGADALVFPSRYEGFGMPVLEARACGTRVVATDIPEIREAGGDECLYIQPNAEGIREGILKALTMPRPMIDVKCLPSWRSGAQIMASQLIGRQACAIEDGC
jgi:glycosyltransferase involved in cell wall biosynthesis